MSSNFLTDARTVLLTRLQVDGTLSTGIRTWYLWGPGLRQRYQIEPAMCPLLSLVPAQLDEEQLSNAAASLPQDLELGIATDGQDAEPCENYVVAALGVVRAANADNLGLAADGLSQLTLRSIRWLARPSKDGARVLWTALITVCIHWFRR